MASERLFIIIRPSGYYDYKIYVFYVAFLPDETIEKFKSDFKIVAKYFTDRRKNKQFTLPDNKTTYSGNRR